MDVQVIMVAHNQIELLKLGMMTLREIEGIDEQNVVIVDNASEDGLREWLEEQQYPRYLICDEGVESYAVILNTVIREFQLEGDILILSPYHVVLPGALEEMRQLLYSEERIGAVSGLMITHGTEEGKDYKTALEHAKRMTALEQANPRRISLWEDAVLIKEAMRKELGEFDERLVMPYNVMLDYLLRGICKGYQLYESAQAYFYNIVSSQEEYVEKFGTGVDREVMKEKWDMNYFNDYPNLALVSCISEDRDKELNVLEIGCDCGANLLEVKRVYPNAQIYGVEINAKSAEIAATFAEVQVGNIEEGKLDFKGVKFDYIMFGDVLEHLRDPAATIRYCRQLLKPDGKIVACIPNIMHYSVMRELLDGNFTYKDMGLLDRTHIHFFTYKEIIKMFEQEGFAIVQMGSIRQRHDDAKEENKQLVKALSSFSDETEEYMFLAYQYLVTARIAQ